MMVLASKLMANIQNDEHKVSYNRYLLLSKYEILLSKKLFEDSAFVSVLTNKILQREIVSIENVFTFFKNCSSLINSRMLKSFNWNWNYQNIFRWCLNLNFFSTKPNLHDALYQLWQQEIRKKLLSQNYLIVKQWKWNSCWFISKDVFKYLRFYESKRFLIKFIQWISDISFLLIVRFHLQKRTFNKIF